MSHDQPSNHDSDANPAHDSETPTQQGHQQGQRQNQHDHHGQNQQAQQGQNQQAQQGQQQQNQRQSGGNQDIRNAQWLTLSRDENILWWGHPSLIPHLPVIATSLFAAIVGIASVFIYPEMIGLKGLIIVPIGIIGAGLDYMRVITTFYVVTNDKVVRKVGVIRRDTIEMRYENIEHVNARQSLIERLLGYGDIDLATAGTAGTESVLNDVRQPRQVAQTINQKKDDAYNQLAHKQLN